MLRGGYYQERKKLQSPLLTFDFPGFDTIMVGFCTFLTLVISALLSHPP